VASLSQGRTAAAQCGLFTHKSVPVIFEPPCTCLASLSHVRSYQPQHYNKQFFSLHKHELLQHTDSHGILVSSSFVVFVAEERIPFCMKARNSIQFLFFIHLPGFFLVISWSFNLEQFCITAIRNM